MSLDADHVVPLQDLVQEDAVEQAGEADSNEKTGSGRKTAVLHEMGELALRMPGSPLLPTFSATERRREWSIL
jgi:hypothetical protein